jgi:23S rRNA pseudouridine2604 synthase
VTKAPIRRSSRPESPSHDKPEVEPLRLSKLMADRSLCSRREADELIAKGWVKVDGQIVDQLGIKVLPSVEIELHPNARRDLEQLATILLNKPVGYVSGQPEKDYEPAVRLITAQNQERGPGERRLERTDFAGLAPAGRLDIDSQGLLVFTQNGQIAKKLIGENSTVEKEYLVRVRGSITKAELKLLNYGLELDGEKLKPAQVSWLNEDQLKFILQEGKKRQIRRMCEAVGLTVVGLKRVRVGRVMLGKLPEGKWRFLRPGEEF